MRKNVVVIYDDTRKPNRDISMITGKKGFGDIIYKRMTLQDRTAEIFKGFEECVLFVKRGNDDGVTIDKNTPVILYYSDFVINNEKAIKILITKSLCAHENYAVTVEDKIACVIFDSIDSYHNAEDVLYDSFPKIATEGLLDISQVNAFRAFITGGFEARFFNNLSGDEYTVVKSSDKINKIKAEYTFYGLLPEDMKQWFVRPYGYKEEDGKASYMMERYHMTDLAIRYIHGAISVEEFEDILEKLFYFVKIRQVKEVSNEEYENMANSLYIAKVEDRINQLKQTEGFVKIDSLIKTLTKYDSIDEIVEEYKKLYEKIRSGKRFVNVSVIGHGDLCFSNILYSKEASLLKLIDPKGALSEEELYMDPYYDLAKLSHSICGNYDFYNSDLFEIVTGDDLRAYLKVDENNKEYIKLFKEALSKYGLDYNIVRLYEASLFISMLPLHMDRPKKVFAFILNAIDIMESLES